MMPPHPPTVNGALGSARTYADLCDLVPASSRCSLPWGCCCPRFAAEETKALAQLRQPEERMVRESAGERHFPQTGGFERRRKEPCPQRLWQLLQGDGAVVWRGQGCPGGEGV